MQPSLKKLLSFTSEPICQHYKELANTSYFADFAEAHGFESLDDVRESIGNAAMQMVIPCMLEFYFSNDYRDNDGKRWNVIDLFLKKRGHLVAPRDRAYLQSLRKSHMSLYEIVEIEIGKSIVLRDLIDAVDPVRVFEKSLTQQVSQWDIMGLRICEDQGRLVLAGGGLPLPRDAGIKLAKEIKSLHTEGMNFLRSHATANDSELNAYSPEDKERLMRVMWAKEIGLGYLEDCYRRLNRKMVLLNKDGHKFCFHTVTFPLNSDWNELAAKLNTVADYHLDEDNKLRKFWNWYRPMDVADDTTAFDDHAEDDVQILETRLSGDDLDGPMHVLGTIELLKGKLVMQANSMERAKVLEQRLVELLGTHLGIPVWKAEDTASSFVNEKKQDSKKTKPSPKLDISPEEQTEIIHGMLVQHYCETLNSPVPGLGNKSPKQLSKTSDGRAKLEEWLKGVENSIRRLERESNLTHPLDIDWMWDELGINRDDQVA